MTTLLSPRRHVLLLVVSFLVHAGTATAAGDRVEQWGTFELSLHGPATGNPFVDVRFSARFYQGEQSIDASGFYDGEGTYRVRFMPPSQGTWKYNTASNASDLDGKSGEVVVLPPSSGNHGSVHVAHTFHFEYADGKPYKELGTTSYVWQLQSESLQDRTLKTLAGSPFNKIRFCVFPKRYDWNSNEPPFYPFEGSVGKWDTERFNPAYFRHLERRIRDLQKLGIEADIILFHPYDRGHWGFDRMTPVEDDRYLRYLVARLSALRNVWWSLANEYDFMEKKTEQDWERIGELVSRSDPYHHLLSIHNGRRLFNHTRSWITHASIQNGGAVEDPNAAVLFRDAYRKPVVYDEVRYEGNIPRRWGNLSAEELVHRFWVGTIAGTYVGHGETYASPDDVLWWSKGGTLKGQSPPRLAFLKKVLEDAPAEGIEPIDRPNPEYAGKASEYYLVYFGRRAPTAWQFMIPRAPKSGDGAPQEGMLFQCEILDTWNMTVARVERSFTLKVRDDYFFADKDAGTIALPGRPFIAIRIKRVRGR